MERSEGRKDERARLSGLRPGYLTSCISLSLLPPSSDERGGPRAQTSICDRGWCGKLPARTSLGRAKEITSPSEWWRWCAAFILGGTLTSDMRCLGEVKTELRYEAIGCRGLNRWRMSSPACPISGRGGRQTVAVNCVFRLGDRRVSAAEKVSTIKETSTWLPKCMDVFSSSRPDW